MTDHDLLAIACEQFLSKTVTEIKAVVLQTLEGHLRSILGRDLFTVLIGECLYRNGLERPSRYSRLCFAVNFSPALAGQLCIFQCSGFDSEFGHISELRLRFVVMTNYWQSRN